MEWRGAVEGIAQDVRELATGGAVGLVVLVLGGLVLALLALVRGRRSAGLLALAVWWVPLAVWFLERAVGRWEERSTEEVVRLLGSFALAWVVVVVDAVVRARRRRRGLPLEASGATALALAPARTVRPVHGRGLRSR